MNDRLLRLFGEAEVTYRGQRMTLNTATAFQRDELLFGCSYGKLNHETGLVERIEPKDIRDHPRHDVILDEAMA